MKALLRAQGERVTCQWRAEGHAAQGEVGAYPSFLYRVREVEVDIMLRILPESISKKGTATTFILRAAFGEIETKFCTRTD